MLFSQMRTSGLWYKHSCTSEMKAVEEQPHPPPFTSQYLCCAILISNAKEGVIQMETSIMACGVPAPLNSNTNSPVN